MGVVRREGDWRLEKRREGVYEITYQKEVLLKVRTSDARSSAFGGPLMEMSPVREVDSYSEVEGLFEEKAHGPPPFGMSSSESRSSANQRIDTIEGDEGLDPDETPPFLIGIAFTVAGIFIMYTFWDAGNTLLLGFGAGFSLVGLIPFGYAAYLLRDDGPDSAWSFLVTVDESSSDNRSTEQTEKTPPAPERLKNEIKFERANRRCEFCGDQSDHLEIHHIKPRAKGGPNTKSNLIALCPPCHRKADDGVHSRSELKYNRG